MSRDALPPVIAAPELAFGELDRRLAAAGWTLGRESQEPPLVAGEPHWCEWHLRDGDAHIAYTFNPVVGLRVLAVSGADAAAARRAVIAAVPHLDAAALRALLDDEDEERVLLGIPAVAAIHDSTALGRLRALVEDARPRVAAAARRACEDLLPGAVESALAQLIADKRAHPGRAVLFQHFAGPEQRRQVLRWLAHDVRAPSAPIDEVLRAALVDADPEVRVTACLVAARLDARAVAGEVAAAALPESSADGADPRERRLYLRLRDAVVRYLRRDARGERARDELPPLYQALTGPVAVVDEMTLLVHALTTPVERRDPAAAPGVIAEGRSHELARVGLALGWVSPVDHWLGPDGPRPSAPRRVASRGFYIARLPLSARAAAWLRAPGPLAAATGDDPAWCGSWSDAVALIARLAELTGAAARLATADEWEMALRGPDGRLFPWGNNLARAVFGGPSPWGARLGEAAEWTADRDGDAIVTVGAGPRQPVWSRARAAPEDACAVRFVVAP